MSDAPPSRSFVAAALPLLAFPLGVVVYAVGVSADHRLDRSLLVIWQANQFVVSMIAVVGLIACVSCSLMAYIGSQRASAVSFAVAPLSGLVVFAGALSGVRSTVVHLGSAMMISPLDRAQFAIAVTKEGLVVFGAGLTLATALLISGAFSQLACPWKASRVAGLVSLVGAIGASSTLARLVVLNDALERGLRYGTGAFVDVVAVETTGLGVPATHGLTLVVLAALVLGVIALRAEPRPAVLLALLGPAAAFPTAALVLTASMAVSNAKSIVRPSSRSALSALPGVPSAGPQLVLGARGAADVSGRPLPLTVTFDSLEQYLSRAPPGDGEPWRVGLEPGARLDDLVVLLQIAKQLEVSRVDLIGSHEVDVSTAAREVRPLLEHLRFSFRAVHLTITTGEHSLLLSELSLEALHAAALDATDHHTWLEVRVP